MNRITKYDIEKLLQVSHLWKSITLRLSRIVHKKAHLVTTLVTLPIIHFCHFCNSSGIKVISWGAWVAWSVKQPTLDFSSGYDLTVHEIKPCIGLCTETVEPTWDTLSVSLCLCLSLSLPCLYAYSVFQIK